MPDRRSVDDLSIEELERILRVKKREARLKHLEEMALRGRHGGLPAPQEVAVPDQTPSQDRPVELPHRSFVERERAARPRTLRDRLLLGIEVVAALGLVGVLIAAALNVRQINEETRTQEAAQIAALPTSSPTPIITAVVLPGGHTPPTSPGGAQPNYDEVPAYLRPQVEQQFAGPVVLPTPGPGLARRIIIPALGVDAPVVQGDGWEQLKQGVAQHLGTGNPGQPGNVVLSAHDDIFGELFRYLDRLKEGDEVTLETLNGRYTYQVVLTKIVQASDVSVMDPTHDPVVTLISCYPYLVNNKRIVVVAKLVSQ